VLFQRQTLIGDTVDLISTRDHGLARLYACYDFRLSAARVFDHNYITHFSLQTCRILTIEIIIYNTSEAGFSTDLRMGNRLKNDIGEPS